MTIVEFVRARLDEREAKARAATEGPWTIPAKYGVHVPGQRPPDAEVAIIGPPLEHVPMNFVVYEDCDYGPLLARADGEHMIANDPPSVLRDVEATRRILDLHTPWDGSKLPPAVRCEECGDVVEAPVPWPCSTLRLLALPYAAHADYDPSWSPA